MKTFTTEIEIQADAARIWQALTQEMPRDPHRFGILRLDGLIAHGGRIKLCSEVSPKRAFALKVTEFDAPHVMVWRGGMPFGLFVGTRRFQISPTATGCMFHMSEVFSGPMAGLITKSIPDLTPSFIKFANALKQKAEQND
ncbi:MAG: SRPBCC domain-containing protein [Aliishimia sp.]